MKRTNLLERVKRKFELKDEPLPGIPLIEVLGSERVLVENHCGVIMYRYCEIKISVRYGCVCITGNDLQLTQMSKDRLVVTGVIECVHLTRRDRCASNKNG